MKNPALANKERKKNIMKALLQNGEWTDIDTSCLFTNQYNTLSGHRIFDAQILKIIDDAREGMGRCRYCGKIVKEREEEKHFLEQENYGCSNCFYYREKVIDRKITETRKDDKRTKTIVEYTSKTCSFHDLNKSGIKCIYRACREYGIEWFTKENTFFLAFPNGLPNITNFENLEKKGFVFRNDSLNGIYSEKIGSYLLKAHVLYENGAKLSVDYFTIRNTRLCYNFRIVDNTFWVYDATFGFQRKKTLDKVPTNVIEKIKAICTNID